MLHAWRVFRSTRLKEHGNGYKPASPVHQCILLRLGPYHNAIHFLLVPSQCIGHGLESYEPLATASPAVYTCIIFYLGCTCDSESICCTNYGPRVLPFPKVCSFRRPKLAGLRLAAWQSSAVLHGSLWGALRTIFLHGMHGHHSCFISDYYLQHAAVPVSRIAESLNCRLDILVSVRILTGALVCLAISFKDFLAVRLSFEMSWSQIVLCRPWKCWRVHSFESNLIFILLFLLWRQSIQNVEPTECAIWYVDHHVDHHVMHSNDSHVYPGSPVPASAMWSFSWFLVDSESPQGSAPRCWLSLAWPQTWRLVAFPRWCRCETSETCQTHQLDAGHEAEIWYMIIWYIVYDAYIAICNSRSHAIRLLYSSWEWRHFLGFSSWCQWFLQPP